MNHEERWTIYYEALKTYQQRYGDALVPTGHLEFLDGGAEVNLGHWVSYMRTRYRQGLLSDRRVKLLEKVPSWTWGPVRPGPKSKNIVVDRNNKIKIEKSNHTKNDKSNNGPVHLRAICYIKLKVFSKVNKAGVARRLLGRRHDAAVCPIAPIRAVVGPFNSPP